MERRAARRPTAGPADAELVLDGGRRLGYATFGDPTGTPVVSCHGGLMSRHDCAGADAAARELGIRLISPDRPGIGLTDRWPGHDITGWADGDLRALLDALGLDRVRVLGWSAGGQHALAAAHVLADRVERVAVVAGCLPIDAAGGADRRPRLSRTDQRLLRWAEHRPSAARGYLRITHLLAVRAPQRLARMSAADLEGDEAGSLTGRSEWFASAVAEATHDPAGQVDDYRAFGAPWGFAPEDVTVPVDVHHGTADRMVPPEWGTELAARLPDATITTYPGAGHLLAVTHARPVLEALVGAS